MRNKGAKQKSTRKRGGSEHAFGCDLTEHLQATGHDVPQVLRTCAEFIEEHGIVDGIYRLSGVTSNIQRLRQEFVTDSCPDLTKELYLQDIHCVGSLCKLYFRELPDPLLTYQLYKKFTDTMSVKGEREQLLHIQSVVKELPDTHLRTLEYLSRHLSYLATLSHQTNMHARNLALVWAPNLLRSKDMEHGASSCAGDSAFLEVRVQQCVVEFILKHTDQIFSPSSEEWSPVREAPVPTVAEKYATLPVPSSSTSCGALKLMSLEEAQARSLGANHPARQRENSLPDTRTAATLYHTVIDLNESKRKLSSKPSKRWKSIFGLGRSAKLSRNGSVLVRTQDNEKAAIRPSKSMDSICSLSIDDNMPSSGNSGGSGSGGGACNGLPIKSRTLGSEADFSLSDENLKVWGFSPKSPKRSVSSTGPPLSSAGPSATGPAAATSQKALPEQLKVFKGDESSGSFRPTSPKNRRMLFSSSSHHASGGGSVVGSAPHLSFFPLESPSLSPRHQRKALNISEPFAVSVPLRVSAVISANSTPCRPGGATAPTLNPTQSLSKAAKALCPSEPTYTGGHKKPDIGSSPLPSEEAAGNLKPQPNTSKMSASSATAQDTAEGSCPSSAGQEERVGQDGRVTGGQPMKCLLPGLEDILSDMTAPQNLSPGHMIPESTSEMPSEGVTPEPSGTPNEKVNPKVTKDPGASTASSSTPVPSTPGASSPGSSTLAPCTPGPSTSPPSSPEASTPAPCTAGSSIAGPSPLAPCTPAPSPPGPSTTVPSSPGPFIPGASPPGTASSQTPTQKAEGASETHPSHPSAPVTKHTPSPQPHPSHPSAPPPSQAADVTKGKECVTESPVLLPGCSDSARLVDIHDSDSLQNLHGNTSQMPTAAKAGVQSQTLEGSMLTAWPKDELRIMENIAEEASSRVQAPCPSAESLDTQSTLTEQSAETPAGEMTHQGPLLAAFDPALSNLGALRETDILSDLEDALTSTTNQTGLQASTKQTQKETVSEASEKSVDSSTAGNDLTTQQIVPAVDKALGGVSAQAPGGRLGWRDDTSQDVTEEKKQGVGRAGPTRLGKERRRKGREREKGLDQVEPWDDLLHTQWVTSPLHTPTIEELFTDSTNRNKMRVSQANVSQLHPDTGEHSQEKILEPSPTTTVGSLRSQAVVSRRNSSPIITSVQLDGRAESSQNPVLQWAPKLPASAAPVARRFNRQASHDSCLSPSAPLQPCLSEQRGGAPWPSSSSHTPSRRHRPCSLDLDRDLDLIFDRHGNFSSYHRVIRDISNQPVTQQNVLDLSTMKSRGNLPEQRDHGSAPWRTSKGVSADFSEELELFLGNPRAPARRNSAPPPVGVASVRAPLTIRTSQAKAVPVIPPKVQYSSMPGSASADLRKLPEDPKKLSEDHKKSPEDQKKVVCKKGQEDCKSSPEDLRDYKTMEEKPSGGFTIATPSSRGLTIATPLSRAKEERENREPVPRVTPSPVATATMPGSSPLTDPLVLRRKNSPCAELSIPDQMHPPPPASALLRQRPSFRNRPRPQSLVLFSPPFPIMDPPSAPMAAGAASSGSQCPSSERHERPHARAAAGLGRAASFWDKPSHRQEEARSRRDRPSGQTSSQDVSSRERVENLKGSEGGVVLRGGSAGCGKMTLPKSGQRLETSPGSCFYQPQRRSMVLDNRSSRQIE